MSPPMPIPTRRRSLRPYSTWPTTQTLSQSQTTTPNALPTPLPTIWLTITILIVCVFTAACSLLTLSPSYTPTTFTNVSGVTKWIEHNDFLWPNSSLIHLSPALTKFIHTDNLSIESIDAFLSSPFGQNLRIGVILSLISIVILCGLVGLTQRPSQSTWLRSPLHRPSPVLWYSGYAIGVIYTCYLIILLLVSKQNARLSLRLIHPTLGVPVPEKTYADQCALTAENVWALTFDQFALAHFVGWAIKMMIIRDTSICWLISISWELIEILFMHMLPNFAECWWDQWILDVLLANGLGIFIGGKLNKYLKMKEYHWNYIPDHLTWHSAYRSLVHWRGVTLRPKVELGRLLTVICIVFGFQLQELNAFFLKHILWVPPPCHLNVSRLAIWALQGTPTLFEIHEYVHGTSPTQDNRSGWIGPHTRLSIAILTIELAVILNHRPGEFTETMPHHRQLLGVLISLVYLLVLYLLTVRPLRLAATVAPHEFKSTNIEPIGPHLIHQQHTSR